MINLVKSSSLLVAIALCLQSAKAVESEVNFFEDSSINYWGNEKKEAVSETKQKNKDETKKKEAKKNKFSWRNHLDVEKDDFFKEGKHTPPAPLMEVARRPTDKNIKNYLKYFGMKNFIKERMQNAIENYIKRTRLSKKRELPLASKKYLIQKANEFKGHVKGREKIRFVMYFRSTCPHCKRMFKTLEELQELGFITHAIQMDKGTLRDSYNIAISNGTQKDLNLLKRLGAKGVPFTLIQVENKKQYSLKGYRSVSEILNLLKAQLKQEQI